MTPEWWARAACRGIDLNLFFPTNGSTAGHAGAWCAQCPVKTLCLDEAMRVEGGRSAGSRYGVYGGLSATERYALHRSRRRAAAKAAGRAEEDVQPREHKGQALAPCGTPAAYERHKRNGDSIDEACMANHTRPRKPQLASGQRAKQQRKPIEHGTSKGAFQHRNRDEQVCPECHDAELAYQRDYRQRVKAARRAVA